jgi:hypothetical protein
MQCILSIKSLHSSRNSAESATRSGSIKRILFSSSINKPKFESASSTIFIVRKDYNQNLMYHQDISDTNHRLATVL